ncbi:MAG TPA: hypothetical protein VFJ27_03905, partial [Terriglobia bacterium]|nr:hypothetical protein [Terriglobia bacterium]
WFTLLLVNSLVMRSGLDRLILSDEGTEVLAAAYVLLYVLQQILQIVIVCQLVQADALAGTTAFWLTRPISRKGLLLSKSLFVLLVLILPSLIAEVIVLRVNGISVSEMLSVLPQEILLPSALFLVPPMLVATLTPSLTRLLVVGVSSVTAFFLVHYSVLASVMTFGTGPGRRGNAVFPGQWLAIFSNNPSATMASAILAVVLGAIVIAHQYLKRRTLHSSAAAVLGTCLVIGSLNFWSWNLLKSSDWLPAHSGFDSRTVKLLVANGPGAGFVQDNGGKLMILRPIEIRGVPPDFFLEIIGHRAVVEFSDGKSVSSSLDYPWGFFSDRGVGGGLQLQVERDVRVLNDPLPLDRPIAAPLLSLDVDTYQKYKETPGTFRAQARLKVYQRLTATLPLKTGSRHKGVLGELALLGIVPNQDTFLTVLSNSKQDGFVVTLRESGVRYWLQRTSLSGASYVLRNRARKEALFGRSYPKDIFGGFPALHRLVINRSPVYFTTAGIPDYQGPVIDDDWLREAELLRVDSRVVGQFSTSVHAENFVMNAR